MDDQETKVCSNCKRSIATHNFTMHELHCHRNIILCSICQEPVVRSQMKEHEESNHSLVKCPLCSEELEKPMLPKHQEQLCMKRQVKCDVCEIEVTFDSFKEHVDYCESRTQECPVCHQYIMMKHLDEHERSNCQYPERPVRQSTEGDVAEGAERPSYVRESSFAAKELHRMFNIPIGSGSGIDMDYTFMDATRPEFGSDSTMLPCEFCNNLFTSDMILAHQSSCPRDPSEAGNHLAHLLRSGMSINRPVPTQIPESRGGDTVDPIFPEHDSLLPCEFCEELFPMSEIPYHQSVCSRDLLSSARGRHPIEVSEISDQSFETAESPPRVENIDDLLRPIAVRRTHASQGNREAGSTIEPARSVRDPVLRFGEGMWSQNVASATAGTRSQASRNRNTSTEPLSRTRRTQPSHGRNPDGTQDRGRGSMARNVEHSRRGNGHRNAGNSRSKNS